MATNPGTELASLDFGNLIGGPLVAVITAQSLAARSTADFIKTVGFYADGHLDADGVDVGGTPVYVDFKYPKEIQPYIPGKTVYVVQQITVVDGGSGYLSTAIPNVTISPDNAGATVVKPAVLTGDKVSGFNYVVPATHLYFAPPEVMIDPPPSGTGNTTATAVVVVSVHHIDPGVDAIYQDMKFSVPILSMLPIPFIKVDLVTIDFNAKISSIETASESSDLAISGSLEVRQRWPSGSAKLNVSCAYKKSSASGSSVERTYSMAIHVQASQDEMPAGMEKLLGILEGAMLSRPA